MQAIHVKYLPATNFKGSRIKASCTAGSLTIGYPHELTGQAVYRSAAEALAAKMKWVGPYYGELHGGCLPDGSFCFVFNNIHSKD